MATILQETIGPLELREISFQTGHGILDTALTLMRLNRAAKRAAENKGVPVPWWTERPVFRALHQSGKAIVMIIGTNTMKYSTENGRLLSEKHEIDRSDEEIRESGLQRWMENNRQ